MSKKGNNLIAILFIVLIVGFVGIFLALYFFNSDDSSKYFNKDSAVASQNLYDNILSINEASYPQTPDEVSSYFADTLKLLYGNKIEDFSIVPTILTKQRILLSDELNKNNSLEQQQKDVLVSIKNLKDLKVYITTINLQPATYDPNDKNLAFVKVKNIDNLFQNYYYIYHLKLQNGKWKIIGWYNTDENYNILENNFDILQNSNTP